MFVESGGARASMGVFDGSTGMLEADPTPETYISMNKTKLLVADDDPFFQTLIGGLLTPDYDLVIVKDGNEAWRELQRDDGPRLAILDWVMPGLSGPQVCRKVRACPALASMYLIILTAKNNEADIVSGLRAGADDYITKPPLAAELRARVRVGERVVELQAALEQQSCTSHRIFGAARSGSDPLASCPTHRRVLNHEHFRGIESGTRELCKPKECCSIPRGESDPLGQRLLSLSLENRHPHR